MIDTNGLIDPYPQLASNKLSWLESIGCFGGDKSSLI
jgi:hypothetical protein